MFLFNFPFELLLLRYPVQRRYLEDGRVVRPNAFVVKVPYFIKRAGQKGKLNEQADFMLGFAEYPCKFWTGIYKDRMADAPKSE
ncbi:hypothetical protein Clacol_005197 [Clathrus columnatus]|uniref:Uncharacterized protein n=1 Tax=Clathrus columnatus TaxID=1419009 RepID=A0AAV5ABW1_9AGAM|nr:hypothetical protein Clacol_005197 [Clathrus columnatus]